MGRRVHLQVRHISDSPETAPPVLERDGGHVVSAATRRTDIAAVVSVVPMVDGLASAHLASKNHTPAQLLASTGRGLASAVRRKTGRGPAMIPVVARPGEAGALTLEGAYEDYLAIAGPTWRNEIAADVVLELGTRAPANAAASLKLPWLVQVADFDRSAPVQAAMKAAFAGRAEVRHYPGDHFDLFPGKPFHGPAVRHALHFLSRTFPDLSTYDLSHAADALDAAS